MSLAAVALNLTLDLTLIWPLAEAGLALATVVSAIVQMAAMAVLFSKAHVALDWPRIWGTGACTMIATAVMAAVGMLLLERIATANTLVRVAGPIASCAVAYIGTLTLVGWAHLQDLFRRG
jgi:peptidoglycan biosynthesis protein MviN/MurJ (putative lipid II flippase)